MSEGELGHLVLFGREDGRSRGFSFWAVRAGLSIIQAHFLQAIRDQAWRELGAWARGVSPWPRKPDAGHCLRQAVEAAEHELLEHATHLASAEGVDPARVGGKPQLQFDLAAAVILPERCVLYGIGGVRVRTFSSEGLIDRALDYGIPGTRGIIMDVFGNPHPEPTASLRSAALRTFSWKPPTCLILHASRLDQAVGHALSGLPSQAGFEDVVRALEHHSFDELEVRGESVLVVGLREEGPPAGNYSSFRAEETD